MIALAPFFLAALLHPARAAPTSTLALPSPVPSAGSSSNSSISAVCDPTQCVQGLSTLTAGIHMSTTFNGSSVSLVLLPGSYVPTAGMVNSSTSILNFAGLAPLSPSPGFTSTATPAAISVSSNAGLIGYTLPFFSGLATYSPIGTNFSNSSVAVPALNSLLLSPTTFAVLQLGSSAAGRTVVWSSVADVGNLPGVNGNGNGSVTVVSMQSSSCPIPCASGGQCSGAGVCVCAPGFGGATCNLCLPGLFGPSCSPCPSGCPTCDDSITGSGRCLTIVALNGTAAACNCINGVCGAGASSVCACSAGWGKATNGTQCAVCATGYFQSLSGDCLACDPSCLTCSGPTGACLTCRPTLGLSADPTKCQAIAALTAPSANTTSSSTSGAATAFTTCPPGAFLDSVTSACVACSPLCSTCFAAGTTGCLACKAPYGLLGGQCVAVDQKSGICNGAGVGGSNAAWVLDNVKEVCDAAPAKCTRASIDNFSSISTRSQLTCSACIAGSYLNSGICVATCPVGTVAVGSSCVACDKSCGTCSGTTTYCTSCAAPNQLALAGACIAGPSCPTGYFSSTSTTTNSTSTSAAPFSPVLSSLCLPCHPDCATCSGRFDICLTCPPSRPVKSLTATCVQTCSSSQYFDTISGLCTPCAPGCATCSGNTSDQCLSCVDSMKLLGGSCIAAGCAKVVPGFGVCLEDLATVVNHASTPISPPSKGYVFPWYFILLLILLVLLIPIAIYFFRKRQQKRRAGHTAKFASDLDRKAVDLKLTNLPHHVAYPERPNAYSSQPYHHEVPGVTEFYQVPVSPTFHPAPVHQAQKSRWSSSTHATKILTGKKLEPQATGASAYSSYSAGGGKQWASNNPFGTGA